jgi:hypothetical protein
MKMLLKKSWPGLIPLDQADYNKLKDDEVYEADLKTKRRSSLQNASLHKMFSDIASQLNEIGHTFNYTGFKGNNLELMYTGTLIKETLWRPIQIALFDIESTTQIDTNQLNKILDIITNHFAKMGLQVVFPSKESLEDGKYLKG